MDNQPVDDGLNGVIFVAVKLDLLVDLANFVVDTHAYKARFAHIFKYLLVVPLAVDNQGREHLDAAVCRHPLYAFYDLLRRLRLHRPAADWAVRGAHAREEQAQVVVDFGDGADGGARVVADALLIDGDGGAQPFNLVHSWLFQLPQELARVCRKRLHVAPLPLGKNGIKGQR